MYPDLGFCWFLLCCYFCWLLHKYGLHLLFLFLLFGLCLVNAYVNLQNIDFFHCLLCVCVCIVWILYKHSCIVVVAKVSLKVPNLSVLNNTSAVHYVKQSTDQNVKDTNIVYFLYGKNCLDIFSLLRFSLQFLIC